MHTNCHLSVLIQKQAEKYGNRRALIYRDFPVDALEFKRAAEKPEKEEKEEAEEEISLE